jgi:hypothetical protein
MEDLQSTLDAYCELMKAIKMRTAVMNDVLTDHRGLPPFCISEIVHLQIRMICELLAIACLVAHRGLKGAQSARLTNAYQADFIMNALEKLHPRFYPRPTQQFLRDGKPYKIEDIKDGFLTKAELLKSYRDAATFLHVGSITELLGKRRRVINLTTLSDWLKKLMVLLSHHNIFLADSSIDSDGSDPVIFSDGTPAPKNQIIVVMETELPGGIPHASLFRTVGKIAPPTRKLANHDANLGSTLRLNFEGLPHLVGLNGRASPFGASPVYMTGLLCQGYNPRQGEVVAPFNCGRR